MNEENMRGSNGMRLTLWLRLKLCFEILTIRSGHKHPANSKQLSTFQNGYDAGWLDRSVTQALGVLYGDDDE